MKITLLDTREKIMQEGTTEKFKQGKQEFVRKHPNIDIYSTIVSKYSTVMKQLIDFLPEQVKKTEVDKLAAFIRKE